MFDVRNAISTILDRYTFADIVEITLRKYRRDKVTPPFLHRSIPLTSVLPEERRHFAASEEPRHAIAFRVVRERNQQSSAKRAVK